MNRRFQTSIVSAAVTACLLAASAADAQDQPVLVEGYRNSTVEARRTLHGPWVAVPQAQLPPLPALVLDRRPLSWVRIAGLDGGDLYLREADIRLNLRACTAPCPPGARDQRRIHGAMHAYGGPAQCVVPC